MTDIEKALRSAVEHRERVSLDDIDAANLLAEVDKLRAEISRRKALDSESKYQLDKYNAELMREVGSLRAELDRAMGVMKVQDDEIKASMREWFDLGKQKPVAWMNNKRDMTYLSRYNEDDVPLYAAPVPSIPNGYQLVPIEPTKAMIHAAESVDWADESIRASCTNQWYKMLAAAKGVK